MLLGVEGVELLFQVQSLLKLQNISRVSLSVGTQGSARIVFHVLWLASKHTL